MQTLIKKLRSTLYFFTGDPRFHRLEHRLFSTISLLNGISNSLGAFNFFSNYSPFLFALNLGTGILFLVFYYFSRVKSIYRTLYWPFVLLIVIFLFVNILTNAGSMGGTHYYMIPALIIAIILSGRARAAFAGFALWVLVTAGIFAVEIMRPDLLRGYDDPSDRIYDVAGQFIFVQMFCGVLVIVLKNHFNEERQKSERLLINILPEAIAEELKLTNHVLPLQYLSASVLFTDFVAFSLIAREMQPKELVAELDRCFSFFDQVVDRHRMEKIKTIGDSYMCVGGLPIGNSTHAVDSVLAALEMCRFMELVKEAKSAAGERYWEVRFGINTGPLVAGVIGERKFTYDVWGDTVNTASRMESSGEPGRINISAATYEAVKDYFECESRGPVMVKHVGMVEMYFVKGLRPELADQFGNPNQGFMAQYEALRAGAADVSGR